MLSTASIESEPFASRPFLIKRFRKETFSISFDRSTFCAYKFRVDLFIRGTVSRKGPQGPEVQPLDVSEVIDPCLRTKQTSSHPYLLHRSSCFLSPAR